VLATVAFTVFMVMVLNGTLFPLITEAVQNKKITVGEPYFNYFAAPFGMIMLFLMGVGPMLPWGAVSGQEFLKSLQLPVAVGIVTSAACFAVGYRGFVPVTTFGLGAFVAVVTVREMLLPARQRAAELKESFGQAFMKTAMRAQRRTGGLVVHLGIVIIVVAVAASSSYKVYATGTLSQGQSLKVGDHSVRFDGLGNGRDVRREWLAANVTITGPNGTSSVHHDLDAPRMNFYDTSNEPVGSPLVHTTLTKDVYVSLLAFDQKTNSASFNAWEFPLVGWIWYAIPILVLGIGLALWPQRKAKVAESASPQTPSAAAPGAAA
jgi:cytochrome c-type biogenesis protein CcmF